MSKSDSLKNLPYYFPDTDLKTLFYVVALLDESDIQIILNKFGSSLKECHDVSGSDETRLTYLIYCLIPETIKEYQRFTTNLFSFLKVRNHIFLRKVIFNLNKQDQDIIFTAYDETTFDYKKDANLPITVQKQIYNILKGINISRLLKEYNEKSKTASFEERPLITALLTGTEKRIYQKCAKNSSSYIRLINEVFPQKERELAAIVTSLDAFFEKYSKAEIKAVLNSLKALKNFPLYDFYDSETLDFCYPYDLTYNDLYNLYGFLVYTLKESLSLRYRGRTKVFDPKTKRTTYVLNCKFLLSYHKMATALGSSLANKIADNINASQGNLEALSKFSVYTNEELTLLKEGKPAIMGFIDEYLSSLSSLEEQNKRKQFLSDF